jgi:hypothetical protein
MRAAFLALMLSTTVSAGQQLKQGAVYILGAPKGESSWLLTANCSDASWLYLATKQERETLVDIPGKVSGGYWLRYDVGVRARVENQTDDCAQVRLIKESSGNEYGWVHKALIRPSLEEQRKQAAIAAAKREQDLKKKQYIASLPKLRGPSDSVIVATSHDCALDYARAVEFGKKNGTGVEFRKKILELITLHCAISLPNGTPVEILSKDAQFVSFAVYSGQYAGTRGFALKENVE